MLAAPLNGVESMQRQIGQGRATLHLPGSLAVRALAALLMSSMSAASPAFLDVRDFGAIPNDDLDDAQAIQAAVDTLPENGGTIHIPAGIWDIDSTIRLSPHVTSGVRVIGDGAGAQNGPTGVTIIRNRNGDAHAFQFESLGYNEVAYLKIIDGSKNRRRGHAIFARRSDGVGNVRISLTDVGLFGHEDGIRIVRGVLSRLTGVTASNNLRHGFALTSQGGGAGAAIGFHNTQAISNGRDGYYVEGHLYLVFSATASDSNGRHGYHLLAGGTSSIPNSNGITFVGAGAETNGCHGLKAKNATSLTIRGGVFVASGADGLRLEDSAATIVSASMSGNKRFGVSAVGGYRLTNISSTMNGNGLVEDIFATDIDARLKQLGFTEPVLTCNVGEAGCDEYLNAAPCER